MNERIGEESEVPAEITPTVTDNSLEIYKIKTDIAFLNLRVQKGEYMPSGFADSKMKEYEDRIHELERGEVEANKPIESIAISTEISETDRLKKEIEWLNKSVQHGTDLNHDDIEKKVLANEARIKELEAGATPAETIPPVSTPEPTPAPAEIPPVPPEQPEVTPAPETTPTMPPTPLTPEAAPVVPPIPETIPPAPATREASPIAGVRLNPENQSRFSRMTEGAKRIATKLYEGIKNIPVIQETVGKIQIAYNQMNANEYEHNMVILKRRVDGLNGRVEAIDTFQAKMKSVIEDSKKKGVDVGTLEEEIRKSEENKNALLKKRDRNQSMFEARDNKRNISLEKRDLVAGKLINTFETKLKPIEKDLEIVHGKLDQIDLEIAVNEAKRRNKLEELDGLEKTKTQIEEALRSQEKSERYIRNVEAIKQLNEIITAERKAMDEGSEQLQKSRIKILEKIAKIDEKASPYRDKRDEYVRIKNTRGADLKVDARKREVDLGLSETVSGHPRIDSLPSEENDLESSDTPENREGIKDVQTYVSLWNDAVKENGGDTTKQIDLTKFTKETKLSNNEALDLEIFKTILTRYYKKNKMPLNTFIQDIQKFEKKLTNK